MKVLAMYLPQFHRVKENDEWWGEGFTEWVAVKNAVSLFEGHYQPRKPLNGNYYDLMDKETMCWQAELMHQYAVDGMCMYHYWFKDGRRILEKPAENLLEWQDVNMPFCFCWANETWARTWSKMKKGNTWASKYEKDYDEKDNGILLEQKYGDVKDWREHFEYLLQFFQDSRYIKINNKPVFVIYRPEEIVCLDDMVSNWNKWAEENGFNGIYLIVAGKCEKKLDSVECVLYMQPTKYVAKQNYIEDKGLHIRDYNDTWQDALENAPAIRNISYCGLVGYDNTPRNEKKGKIFQGQTPELFKKYLTELLAKNEVLKSPFTFINAWNEWGEGMYLEPDEKDGYAYLEAIPYAKEHYKEYLEKYKKQLQNSDKGLYREYSALAEKCDRYEGYWRILDKWLCHKEDGVSLESYFIKYGIKSIAIYGGGMLGRHLLEELKDSGVKVEYVIDRKADVLKLKIPVYSLEDELPEVDAVVVSTTYVYAEIKKKLQTRGFQDILSLENIVMEV